VIARNIITKDSTKRGEGVSKNRGDTLEMPSRRMPKVNITCQIKRAGRYVGIGGDRFKGQRISTRKEEIQK